MLLPSISSIHFFLFYPSLPTSEHPNTRGALRADFWLKARFPPRRLVGFNQRLQESNRLVSPSQSYAQHAHLSIPTRSSERNAATTPASFHKRSKVVASYQHYKVIWRDRGTLLNSSLCLASVGIAHRSPVLSLPISTYV
ncbi:hypothetical protein C8R42DRAFT_340187 [Lentinula raphanica]|nr:hypothetical protein C8R42DRAFT_340187 [Lentinula raphanica]